MTQLKDNQKKYLRNSLKKNWWNIIIIENPDISNKTFDNLTRLISVLDIFILYNILTKKI